MRIENTFSQHNISALFRQSSFVLKRSLTLTSCLVLPITGFYKIIQNWHKPEVWTFVSSRKILSFPTLLNRIMFAGCLRFVACLAILSRVAYELYFLLLSHVTSKKSLYSPLTAVWFPLRCFSTSRIFSCKSHKQ